MRYQVTAKEIKPSEVYKRRPQLPRGYTIVDFRPSQDDDMYLGLDGSIRYDVDELTCENPRFIITRTHGVASAWE